MRRVQRFYAAQGPIGEALPEWKIFANIGARMGGDQPRISAARVMRDIMDHVPRYAGMDYTQLAHVEDQFPDVGGDDLYYGGTAYTNHGGLGVQWPVVAEDAGARLAVRPVNIDDTDKPDGLVVVPIRVLYNREMLFQPSEVMHRRVPAPYAELNHEDAEALSIHDGDRIALVVGDHRAEVAVRVNGCVPVGHVLWPQQLNGLPLSVAPAVCAVQKIEE
jgi:predicted molibdopterin-dependent oxidoreductase YjgC